MRTRDFFVTTTKGHPEVCSELEQTSKDTLKTGFSVLLNVSLFCVLAEAVLFLPYIYLPGLLGWVLTFAGFQAITRIVINKPTKQTTTLLSCIAGLIVGMGPVVILPMTTVSQLFVIPSVLLVLSACSLPLLKNYFPATAGFTTFSILSFSLAMQQLNNTLPTVWPVSWLAMGGVILWVGKYCARRNE